jgi:hypothetical protein
MLGAIELPNMRTCSTALSTAYFGRSIRLVLNEVGVIWHHEVDGLDVSSIVQ